MIDTTYVNDLIGAPVHGSDDSKIGTVGQVYVDNETQAPSWVTVKTGLFGSSESFVPVSEANWTDGVVRVPFEKEFVKDAPRIEDDGALSPEDESALYDYYGNGRSSEAPVYDQRDVDQSDVGQRDVDHDSVGHDTSGPNTDDAMTRSEEQLRVGTEKVEIGRARLRKHVVTEQVTKTVPVSREEVVIEREPITDANRSSAMAGGELTSEEHEVVLTGERVVVEKETVPVERVRLDTKTVTENREVTEDVSHEVIEQVTSDSVDGDPRTN